MPRTTLTDGQTTCIGGMNSGQHPSLLNVNEIAYGLNVTLRGGFPITRPRFLSRVLKFASIEHSDWVLGRRLQGRKVFHGGDGDYLVISVEGRIFTIDLAYNVAEITPQRATLTTAGFVIPNVGSNVDVSVASSSIMTTGYPLIISGATYRIVSVNNLVVTVTNLDGVPTTVVSTNSPVSYPDANDPTTDQVWMQQAESWFVIQNDVDQAILFNGSVGRRSNITGDKPEVPAGSVMEYAEGRLWVVVQGRRQIAAGDLFDPFNVNSPITFSEENVVGQTGRFVMPTGDAEITGIRVIPNLDTSQGQGPLLVFTQTEVASINVPYNRQQWTTVNYPITRLVASMYGSVNQDSIVVVNGDIWNRAIDGLRSFIMAASAFNEWGNVPQSREVSRLLAQDSEALLKFCSGTLFDNRLLMTYGATRTPNGIKHQGLVALDFDIISALTKKDMPAYDGAWTGINTTTIIADVFNGEERCFVFGLDYQNKNELWEITKDFGDDNNAIRIFCAIETRSMDFKTPFAVKRLMGAEGWLDELVGTVDFSLWWKPDFSPCWFKWGDRSLCVKDSNCPVPPNVCLPMVSYNPGFRSRFGFTQPPDDCEPHDNKPARICYRSQLRLEWTGNAAVKTLLLKADEIPTTEYPVVCD